MRSWDYGVRKYTDLVVPPSEDPVDVAYIRDKHLRATNGTVEDDRILRAIKAATQACEHFTQRALMPQTWALVLDRFPQWEIQLPRPPLIEVTSIVYVDEDGVEQTLSASLYRVIRQTGPMARRSTIEPEYEQTWPTTRCQRDAVTVTYRAGYVDGGSPEMALVPDGLLEGIGMRAAEFYKQREDSVVGFGVTVTPTPMGSRQVWQDYRIF